MYYVNIHPENSKDKGVKKASECLKDCQVICGEDASKKACQRTQKGQGVFNNHRCNEVLHLKRTLRLMTPCFGSYSVIMYLYLLVLLIGNVVSIKPPYKYSQHIHSLPELYKPTADNTTYFSKAAQVLKVLDVNMWGLKWPLGSSGHQRFKILRNVLRRSDYDFVILQEVWYKSQHDLLKGSMPFITSFKTTNPSCSGRFYFPLGCSGVTVLSRYPIEFAEIRPFSVRGSFWNFDGEVLVKKGVVRARSRWKGFVVDIFATHLISYTNNPNYDNTEYRYLQAEETARAIRHSNADIKIFGGDINALPYLSERQPYRMLRSVMQDSLIDRFGEDASFHPFFSTFGNPTNTYSSGAIPERIDFLLFASRKDVKMRTFNYVLPNLMGRQADGNLISLSDHEAIHAEYLVERQYLPHLYPQGHLWIEAPAHHPPLSIQDGKKGKRSTMHPEDKSIEMEGFSFTEQKVLNSQDYDLDREHAFGKISEITSNDLKAR